jgi:hypothetical protein
MRELPNPDDASQSLMERQNTPIAAPSKQRSPTILSRFANNLLEQNWTAISIEFVLLVLGVFLGIQVANWNEARVERELVRGHLSEIADDLRTHLSLDA